MNQKRPFILISNDDGYHANGIKTLVSFLKDRADLLVCAPEAGRSGFACAFSVAIPLRLKRRHNMGDAEVWSCNGTPVDCVKLAVDQLCSERRPDLIFGGINHGDNASVNSHYSGTMGVAREGCMKYIPSVAFSTSDYDEEADLRYLRDDVCRIVDKVLAEGLPKGVCLNVNFPANPPFKGVKVCRMAFGSWVNEVVKARHPHGYDYYWLAGECRNDEPEAADSDHWALQHGYIAITPTRIDVTDYGFIGTVKGWNL